MRHVVRHDPSVMPHGTDVIPLPRVHGESAHLGSDGGVHGEIEG